MTHMTEDEYKSLVARRKGAAYIADKPKKYHNQPTEVDGHKFPSKREAARYMDLKLEEKAGRITELRLQVPFSLTVYRMHICDYVADFVYKRDGAEIVEDSKGMKDQKYPIKKKLMLAVHGITILET